MRNLLLAITLFACTLAFLYQQAAAPLDAASPTPDPVGSVAPQTTATPPVSEATPAASPETVPPTGMVTDCGNIGGVTYSGGETVMLIDPLETLAVALPAVGEFAAQPTGLPGDAFLVVCHRDSGASVVISATTGLAVQRVANDAAGDAVLDQVLAGVTLGPGRPSPPPLTPPNTGDGGLR